MSSARSSLAPTTVLGLLAVALAARLPSLRDGLWYDELAAFIDYAVRGPVHVLTTYQDPANHVLQSLLTWASAEAFGGMLPTELALRLPALLVSLAAIPMVAWLARRATGDARTATLAAILAAGCPVLALSGTEARGYAFMIASAAGSTAAWLAWMEDRERRMLAAYAGLVLLGTWAHPVTAVVAAGHAVAGLALASRNRDTAVLGRGVLPVAIAGTVTLLAYAPLLGSMLGLRSSFARGSAGGQPALLGPEGWHALLQLGGAWSTWAAPGLVLMLAGTAALASRSRDDHRSGVFLLAWISGGGVAILAIAGLGTWVYARFLLFLVPGALVATAMGLRLLFERRRVVGRLALVALLAGWGADLITRGPRQPIREAAMFVLANASSGDAVHAIGLRQQVSRTYLGTMPFSWSPEHGTDLIEELPAPAPTWVLMLYPQHVTDETRTRLREAGYAPRARFDGWIDWGGGDVHVWERRRATP